MAILGFTTPFFGVFFAPIVTPHLADKYGRRPVYTASMALFSFCVLIVGLTTNFGTLLAFRFFAGLFGGPCLVLIEGTFADMWSAEWTVTYYSFLTLASFLGAAAGPIVGNMVLDTFDSSYVSWVALLLAILALSFGSGMPETYSRAILRTRIRFTRTHTTLTCAPSGVTLGEMVSATVTQPLKMLCTEPIVLMITLYLGLNFGLVFQWFVTVPVALGDAYHFTGRQAGMAFLSAVGGAVLALVHCSALEALVLAPGKRRATGDASGLTVAPIERRLVSAMFGGTLAAGALFWVSFTVSPTISPYIPILGTGLYVWGNAMVLIALISYLFDAYPASSVLSALTVAACFRLLCAGVLPLFILDIIQSLPKGWTFSTFGGISALFLAFPIILYVFGPTLRARSKYNQTGMRSALQLEVMVTRPDEAVAIEIATGQHAFLQRNPRPFVPKSEWD
jgi:MFS transporter, DHA1 family, multidrug resistance protein